MKKLLAVIVVTAVAVALASCRGRSEAAATVTPPGMIERAPSPDDPPGPPMQRMEGDMTVPQQDEFHPQVDGPPQEGEPRREETPVSLFSDS